MKYIDGAIISIERHIINPSHGRHLAAHIVDNSSRTGHSTAIIYRQYQKKKKPRHYITNTIDSSEVDSLINSKHSQNHPWSSTKLARTRDLFLSGVRAVRGLLSIGGEVTVLFKDVLDVVGPFKTRAVMQGWVEAVILHAGRQKCTVL